MNNFFLFFNEIFQQSHDEHLSPSIEMEKILLKKFPTSFFFWLSFFPKPIDNFV